ncbi:tRNA 2-thiouridine(34) synthase MnmA [Desulfonatronovibrio hydrogenovorans]|uniref:tRNA 2-thiouridine(34) synthase MnmA n=1 Tax=Desulfonatronovibrio hydrogenovorans TaxID=53245 RepID=UPI00048C9E58|nr:tRNA 2-thiouridine(34) synthase MnmA [Desulfonatronovibrio hydrogenovorans]
MKTAVALSGGTDSLASLMLLMQKGYELIPFHARFFPPSETGKKIEEDLARICSAFKLNLHILDLVQDFDRLVVRPFVLDYLNGLTPNPCARCNRQIKFGLILEQVTLLGADTLATGHYAGVRPGPKGPSLWRGLDHTKDQSYFLSLVPNHVFARVIFPLHGTTKSNAYEILKKNRVTTPVKAESNEICFIDDDYRTFISSRIARHEGGSSGPIKDTQGVILGWHQGLWRYTQGQRRGLGIAYDHPLYVIQKDVKTNTLIVGSSHELKTDRCSAGKLNLLCPADEWPDQTYVQTRYRQQPVEAQVTMSGQRLDIVYKNSAEIPAPGQIAAVYSGQGRVLAAGIISSPDQ